MLSRPIRFFLGIHFLMFLSIKEGIAQIDYDQSIKDHGILAKETKLILVDSGFAFTEGPAVDKYGNIFFTDQPNDRIWKYDTNGILSIFMSPSGRSNGMSFDANGNLISCADLDNQLWSIDTNKKVTVLIKDYHGLLMNGPNDIWVAPSGGIYITDPFYERPYWKREYAEKRMLGEKLYFLSPDKKLLTVADSTVVKPNGIVGTPDGKYLYVADMGPWKTYRYDIYKDGSLRNKILFANEASDGMTLDDRGNVYFTNNGVSVYDSTGNKIGYITVPEKWTANICFGGKDKSILFITASKSVYIIPTLVKGVE